MSYLDVSDFQFIGPMTKEEMETNEKTLEQIKDLLEAGESTLERRKYLDMELATSTKVIEDLLARRPLSRQEVEEKCQAMIDEQQEKLLKVLGVPEGMVNRRAISCRKQGQVEELTAKGAMLIQENRRRCREDDDVMFLDRPRLEELKAKEAALNPQNGKRSWEDYPVLKKIVIPPVKKKGWDDDRLLKKRYPQVKFRCDIRDVFGFK